MLIIDMPMPTRCDRCPCALVMDGMWYCKAFDDSTPIYGNPPRKRRDWCPIKGELKEKNMKYRKKPVIIEAYQTDKELDIETLEGTMHASVGDYIITGINGEQYPCKPNIFEKTYEPADNGKVTEVHTANAELIKNARFIADSIHVHSMFQTWEIAEKVTLEKCADALEAADDQIEILQNQIKAYKEVRFAKSDLVEKIPMSIEVLE